VASQATAQQKNPALPGSYCSACGTLYPRAQHDQPPELPRHCQVCGTTDWRNPVPVSVLVQPVYRLREQVDSRGRWEQATDYGVLLGRRGIPPELGGWCVPGGFASFGDGTHEQAAHRELTEEVSLAHPLPFSQHPPRLWMSLPGKPGQILAFCLSSFALPDYWLATFAPCQECTEVRVAWQPEPLCFPAHTTALSAWCQQRDKLTRGLTLLDQQTAGKMFYAARRARQESCQHEWKDAPDKYDYHKREDYSRCKLCGVVR